MPGQERRNFFNKLAREAEEAARQIINLKALYDNILLHRKWSQRKIKYKARKTLITIKKQMLRWVKPL